FHLRTTEELTSNSRASPESVISPRRTRSICSFLKAVVNSRRPSAPLRNSPILLLLEEVQHNLSQVSTPIGGRRCAFSKFCRGFSLNFVASGAGVWGYGAPAPALRTSSSLWWRVR